jgi:hypothetical protein
MDFSHSDPASILGTQNDLALIEYVFDLGSEWEYENRVIADVMPAIGVASRILREEGTAQVRFGEFTEVGLTGLIRAGFRSGTLADSVGIAHDGCTFIFRKSRR